MTSAVARGGLRALALAAAAGAVASSVASAHVTIAPSSSRPADLQRYRLLVPNESENGKAVTEVDVQLPSGITFALADYQPPWRVKLVRRNGEIREIRWTGGLIPPDGYTELSFIARNPVREGAVAFKALQRYSGGHIARWIGPKDSDNPAPLVDLSETALPQDIVSVHGEKIPTATTPQGKAVSGTETPASSEEEDGDTTSTLALVAGLLGLALGGAALTLTLRRSRRGSQPAT